MPQDLATLAQPQLVLLAWAAGLALASGAVALARIVGPGFIWLAASVAALISLAGVLGYRAWWARAGIALVLFGLILARNRLMSGIFLVTAGIAFLVQASQIGGWIPAASATLALGGVSTEMLLGHWYLVDPRLPRWMLKTLAVTGIVGLAVDAGVLALAGLPAGEATIAFWVLLGTSILLMVGVYGSLRYPAYSGVMAATGLSYLAVLTTLGADFLGRALVAGLGPFGS